MECEVTFPRRQALLDSHGEEITEYGSLIRHMVSMSGKKAAEVSRELGKSSGYLAVLLADGRTPRTDLFVKIVEACGYRLVLEGHGESIAVTD